MDIAALRENLTDAGVKYAIASYVDMHGISKSKMVPLSLLGQMMHTDCSWVACYLW